MYSLLRMNQKEIENMKRIITSSEIESAKKKERKLLINRSSEHDGFTWILPSIYSRVNTYQSQAIPQSEEAGTCPNSFSEASIEWYQTKAPKGNDWPISLMNVVAKKNLTNH